jgi:hypothetical protein
MLGDATLIMRKPISGVSLVALLGLLAFSCSPGVQRSGNSTNSNIIVASITHSPNPVHPGDGVVFNYALSNMGTAAGTYSFDLIVDGRTVTFDRANATLQAGDNVSYGMSTGFTNWRPTKAGRYTYELVIVQPHRTNTHRGNIDVVP